MRHPRIRKAYSVGSHRTQGIRSGRCHQSISEGFPCIQKLLGIVGHIAPCFQHKILRGICTAFQPS